MVVLGPADEIKFSRAVVLKFTNSAVDNIIITLSTSLENSRII